MENILAALIIYAVVKLIIDSLPFSKEHKKALTTIQRAAIEEKNLLFKEKEFLSEIEKKKEIIESEISTLILSRNNLQDLIEKDKKTLDTPAIKVKFDEFNANIHNLKREISSLKHELVLSNKKNDEKEKIIVEKSQSYPWLADFYADYLYTYDLELANNLIFKTHPAKKASDDVRRIAKEKRELVAQNKMLEHQLTVYEDLFPWLLDFKELSIEDAAEYAGLVSGEDNEYSALKHWLSPEEYQNLTTKEKYQLALDRYIHKPKSNWQVGIDYERYIGYLYEQKGYRVKYNGALSGLEDMGRDLIATSGKYIIVIQCKRWAQEKTIHEKHIFQLFGSMVLAEIENPGKIVRGLFVTTTKLSDTAIQCAKHLGIEIVQNKPMADYPMIKCNISKDGEKIYHLPFDQQYDKIMLNPKDGDFYCKTISEAEDKGFRRAWRWHGTN